MFSSDYTPVWEEGATATTTGNFEDSVTFEAADAGSTGDAGHEPETNGPLTARVEQSAWTEDDLMLALQIGNLVLFVIAVWMAYTGQGGA